MELGFRSVNLENTATRSLSVSAASVMELCGQKRQQAAGPQAGEADRV